MGFPFTDVPNRNSPIPRINLEKVHSNKSSDFFEEERTIKRLGMIVDFFLFSKKT